MLSTDTPLCTQRRRTMHRRQNSTPAAFEATQLRQLPTNLQRKRQQRSGMSLELRGLDLDAVTVSDSAIIPEQINMGPDNIHPFERKDGTVSITNIGQQSQHIMQVAQTHSQPQPGAQDAFLRSPVQTSLPSPRTPARNIRQQSPQQPSLSPPKAPTEQQLKDLREHIQSVYGSCGQVFINILPTPTATPQKPPHGADHERLDSAPLAPPFTDIADINLQPTASAMTFDFENPDVDLGYESSSYYTSDAVSPSPISSPHQKTMHTFLEGIKELPAQELEFSTAPQFTPSDISTLSGLPHSALLSELDIDATLEYTGVSPEEVQRYISEQDPATNKWTCLYPECEKVFGRRENIRSHVQTHLNDRQYKCNGCGKCFVRQHDLKRHAKIHTGNKPYKCPCGAGFARQDALTRHRQRGMCVGGFPTAVRRHAKRGRPKKNRPDIEERVDKANRTRRAIGSTASSVSASSPASNLRSSPPLDDILEVKPMQNLLSETASFSDSMHSTVDPFNFENVSSPFIENPGMTASSFASSSSYADDVSSIAFLQHLSQNTHTPPMSPADHRPHSSGSVRDEKLPVQSSPLKGSSTPSRSSIQSNPFSTPPTSPVGPKDDLEELFNTLPDSSCSQFDLEMKAMGEFASLDSTTYDFLDFTV